jgi:hypothetical protein
MQVAPVVHQLDHFLDELTALADSYIHAPASSSSTSTTAQGSAGSAGKKFGADLSARYRPRNSNVLYVDRAWQALAASQCLFDCADSVVF